MAEPKKKLTGSDRRESIIKAARPLFAQYGFQGASIRKIAKAAGVSEALLYQHFPGKDELYREILRYGTDVSMVFTEGLDQFQPGAEYLSAVVYLTFRLILTEIPKYREAQYWHERLLFQSLLGDGAYAGPHFENLINKLREPLELHIRAAEADGDLVRLNVAPTNRFWFVHHLAMALNLCHLSGSSIFPYEGSKADLLQEAVLFSLRGLGLTDGALERCCEWERLEAFYLSIYG